MALIDKNAHIKWICNAGNSNPRKVHPSFQPPLLVMKIEQPVSLLETTLSTVSDRYGESKKASNAAGRPNVNPHFASLNAAFFRC